MENSFLSTDETEQKSDFISACRNEAHSRVPVWFMRQAGRSLPEYKKIRGTGSILDAVSDPERAAKITLQPVERYGVDAAILFSDIMVPVHSIGFGIDIQPGIGPVAEHPFESTKDLKRLRSLEPEIDVSYVGETIKILSKECPVPIIGFAGAPFTVASYLIEGKPSRSLKKTKALMEKEPEVWDLLMNRLSEITISSLKHQIESGVSAIQLFDSWAGLIDPKSYEQKVFPYSKQVLSSIGASHIPKIHFGVGTEPILNLIAAAGADVVGIDSKTPINIAREKLGNEIAIQGNLDPEICLEPIEVVEKAVSEILTLNDDNFGHIFNLGHGVLPDTDPDVLSHVVEMVHSHKLPERKDG
tara:strand:- start:3218 stop:4291 length:1074 start_codon:yes stop_codon:yes gene_type:complete